MRLVPRRPISSTAAILRQQRGQDSDSTDRFDELLSTPLPGEQPKARPTSSTSSKTPAAAAPRKTVKFSYDDGGATAERMLFFSADDVVGSASIAEGEAAPGVEPGRVVEIRR